MYWRSSGQIISNKHETVQWGEQLFHVFRFWADCWKKQPSQGMALYSRHEVQNTQVYGEVCLWSYTIRRVGMFVILNSVFLASYSLIVLHVLIIRLLFCNPKPAVLSMFTPKMFPHADFFLNLPHRKVMIYLCQKGKTMGGHQLRFGENMPQKIS